MLCVVIKGPSKADIEEQLNLSVQYADLVELRLDLFDRIDLDALKVLRAKYSIPMIFTLRSKGQGGEYRGNEEERIRLLCSLAVLKPEYLDLEYDLPPSSIASIVSVYSSTNIILSYHNFVETPRNLDAIYQTMQQIPAHFYKIAVMSHCTPDAMRLLCWTKGKAQENLIAVSMGIHGQISRIVGPITGSFLTYACLEEQGQSPIGQIDAKRLVQRYHYKSLHPKSKIYGLIGDPIEYSVGDIVHNAVFKEEGIEAVYVKMRVQPDELASFLFLARQIPLSGLSVTMPLKEAILPFLDSIEPEAKEIGAVNTVQFHEGEFIGWNTDGIGALDAIEQKLCVKGKHVLVIGAGGAAKAIIYEASQRGAKVTVVNRNKDRAAELANRFGCACKARGLDEMKDCYREGYDVLINSTPDEMPILAEHIIPGCCVMDIQTRSQNPLLLQHAFEKGCVIVEGRQMFLRQAEEQRRIWFSPSAII